jgi:hypothetical protein
MTATLGHIAGRWSRLEPRTHSLEGSILSDPTLSAHEHREHAEQAAHEHDPFISRVSITIAILAVLAATSGSLETIEAGGAIIAANHAVLEQNKASDAWAEYQADSLKRHLYGIAADNGGANAQRYRQTSDEQKATQATIKRNATEDQKARDTLLAEEEQHEHRHRSLTLAATLLEIGIAVCTVAIITRRKPFWLGSILLGAGGSLMLLFSYIR